MAALAAARQASILILQALQGLASRQVRFLTLPVAVDAAPVLIQEAQALIQAAQVDRAL